MVYSHYVELINLKLAPNTAKGLRTLYHHIEKHPRSLEALEENIDQNIFISMITSKIPKEVLIQLELQKGARNKWTVRELRELFSNYVVVRERAEQNHYTAKGETREDYYKSGFQQTVGSVMHLTGVTNVQNMIQQRNENKR